MLNSESQYYTRPWRIVAIVATVIIVLSIPIYLISNQFREIPNSNKEAQFVGRQTCIACHKTENDLWLGSDHDKAMDSANAETVLGNFDNYEFVHKGQTHRMFTRDGKYYMNTLGPHGKNEDFRIDFTFGVWPLQQYLVAFDGGRLQCLPIAWDSDKNRWFNLGDTLYANEKLDGNNWLFWTNQAQNWNGMCADCHSTNLQKNYDAETQTYKTTWSEIDVSCEACHGPASEHLKWAQLPEGSRPENTNTGLLIKTSKVTNVEYVNNCARCHSRRSGLSDFSNDNSELLNYMLPQTAKSPIYFHDGQILDEDYEYSSFTQSKMYANDVKCGDCHDPHSAKIKIRGNGLCLQCHQPEMYDTPKHHFHKMPGGNIKQLINNRQAPTFTEGEGALCVNCHMSGREYMGVDYRRDHSLRIPRPDLTISLGAPNACTDCHKNESPQWAQNYILKWYGIKERPHYGTTYAAAQNTDLKALPALINYSKNEVYPLMVRATATSLLSAYNDSLSFAAITNLMTDPESLVRHSAVSAFHSSEIKDYLKYLFPLLSDPTLAIRSEAAYKLSELPRNMFKANQLQKIDEGLKEFERMNLFLADFPGGSFNLGNMFMNKGDINNAAKYYERSLKIDPLFYQAKANLAIIYNQQGKNKEAEKLLKELIREYPEMHSAYFSLALLLAEMKKMDESKKFMLKSAELMPENARIWYNLGIFEIQANNSSQAEKYYSKAVELEPENLEFLLTITQFYLNNKMKEKAVIHLKTLQRYYPNNEYVLELAKNF